MIVHTRKLFVMKINNTRERCLVGNALLDADWLSQAAGRMRARALFGLSRILARSLRDTRTAELCRSNFIRAALLLESESCVRSIRTKIVYRQFESFVLDHADR